MIIKTKYKTHDPFVRLAKSIVDDPNLSWKAKGILSYCMSKPDDWTIRVKEMQRHATDGSDSLRSGISELVEAGYCQTLQLVDGEGKFIGYQYTFADTPMFSVSGKSVSGKSVNGKPDPTKKEDTKIISKDITPSPKKVYEGRPKNVPMSEIIAILLNERPSKKFVRKAKYGATEKGVAKFWRLNGKATEPFRELCRLIEESDYLMGRNGHDTHVAVKNPDWSWVFKVGNNGELNAVNILNGKYSNENMAFALENAKKERLEEVHIVGYNEKRKVDLSDPKYQVVGKDEVSGLKKVVGR